MTKFVQIINQKRSEFNFMEARIEELMGVIKKKLIEEIIKHGPDQQKSPAEAAGVQHKPSKRSRSPEQDRQVKESIKQIKEQIKRINSSLRTIERKQNKNQCKCNCQNKQFQHKRSETAGNFHYQTAKNIKTFDLPSHLDDHQVRQALYNPQIAQSEYIRREKRRSYYDEVYQEAEKRIEDIGRSYVRKGRSKIGDLIDQDRKRGRSRTQKNRSSSDEDN